MNGPRRPRFLVLAFLATLLFAMSGLAHAQFSGSIFTSLADGTTVNANLYDNAEDVYLNGGPQNLNSAGLPDGAYFFQVTTPNGALLLSTTNALDRIVCVVDGKFAYRCDSAGNELFDPVDPHPHGSTNAFNGSRPVQLWPFNETTNNGGEYKVWLIKKDSPNTSVAEDGIHLNFNMKDVKTDNFKVKTVEGPGDGMLRGTKFYDHNMNGLKDPEDVPVEGFIIKIILDDDEGNPVYATTDSNGNWEYGPVENGTTYYVCEVLPGDDPDEVYGPGANENWIQTAPAELPDGHRCYEGTVNGDVEGLDFGNILGARLSGHKWYDSNVDGIEDPGEPGIEGFKIVITATTPLGPDGETIYTDSNGDYESKLYPDGTTFEVAEVLPPGNWLQTYPADPGTHTGSLDAGDGPFTVESTLDDETDLDFGNVLLGAGGGHTIGFWGNKNGKDTMNDGGSLAPELAILNALFLRNAAGADQTFASYSAFDTWLKNASATNMAYMLSAQLAAMVLNVEAGFVDPNAMIYAPGTTSANGAGFATVQDIIDEAAAAIQADGLTLAGDPNREYQTALKNALDNANNNASFIVLPPVIFVPHPY